MKKYFFVDCPLEIPEGWDKMVEQMLDEIEPIAKLYPEFGFIQIKEKYNRLVCYPSVSIPEVEEILRKYAEMASFVCAKCGEPATKEMQNYVLSYCDDCWKDQKRHDNWVPLELNTEFEIITYPSKTVCKKNFKKEWEKLYDIKL